MSGVISRRTDDLGQFRIFGVPPGRYLIAADVDSTADEPDYGRTYFPGTSFIMQADPVVVAEGEDTLPVEFPLARDHARLSGHVIAADGHAFSGAVFLIASARSGALAPASPARTRTDDGTFTFDRLAPGEYVLQAGMSRESPASEGEFGTAFLTVNGTGMDDVILRLSAGSSVSGHLIFEGGPPPLNTDDVELSAVPSETDFVSLAGDPVARAAIQDDGAFAMQGLNGPRRLLALPPRRVDL